MRKTNLRRKEKAETKYDMVRNFTSKNEIDILASPPFPFPRKVWNIEEKNEIRNHLKHISVQERK